MDANNNGIRQAGEPPIPNVTITLTGTDVLGNPVTQTTTTDSTGRYTFTDIVPGTYTVTQTQPAGYLDGKEQDAETGNLPAPTVGNDVFSNIILRNGQNRGSFNFGELAPASIGDYVWNDTNYNGRQDAGEAGLTGVTVNLTGTDDLGNDVSLSTQTGSSGLYTFSDLRPGSYRVAFVAPAGYQFTIANASIATDATDSDVNPFTGQTSLITLSVGEEDHNWDAGLFQLINGSITGVVWSDDNNNGILGSGEAGIPGQPSL